MERGAQLLKANSEVHQKITPNLQALESVLDNDQQTALQMALVHYTDSAWNLGLRLGDESDGTTMADKMEQFRAATPEQILQAAAQASAELQQERYVQSRIMRDRVERGRRVTSAPPIMTNPKGGGVAPPKDLHQLAAKSDRADDYIKTRRAQEKRAQE